MKLGVVGTGMIVRMIGPNWASWGIDVAAVADTPSSMDEVNELADQFGAAGRCDDYHELIADPGVDTVYVPVSTVPPEELYDPTTSTGSGKRPDFPKGVLPFGKLRLSGFRWVNPSCYRKTLLRQFEVAEKSLRRATCLRSW